MSCEAIDKFENLGQTNRQTDQQTHIQTDKETIRQTDKQTNRQTDRQDQVQSCSATKNVKQEQNQIVTRVAQNTKKIEN